MPMPKELEQLLNEYLDTLPWYKRWTMKAALWAIGDIPRPMGCTPVLVILFVAAIFFIIWYTLIK